MQFLRYDYDLVGNLILERLLTGKITVNGDNNGFYDETYTYDSAGRLLNGPLGANYTYGDPNHLHAVTSVGSNSYSYDANGNVTSRTVGGNSYTLSYDAENRLTSVSGAATASFVYDGDGARVKGIVNGVTTIYVGNHYEVSGNIARKYYYAGNQRIAMREGTAGHLWLFNDHLGSTGYTYSATTKQGELRYKPFGSTRYTWGNTPTSYRYTGQREENALGLYYYGARWYDPGLGRFIQPDTIIPNPADAKSFDRYAYTYNNPLRYSDPTGHCIALGQPDADSQENQECLGLMGMIYYELTQNEPWAQTWLKAQGCNECSPEDWRDHYGLAPNITKAELQPLANDAYIAGCQRTGAVCSNVSSNYVANPMPPQTIRYCDKNCLITLGIDTLSIGSSIAVVGASTLCGPGAPVCVAILTTGGTYVGYGTTVASVAWTGYLYNQQPKGASDADVRMTMGTAGANLLPPLGGKRPLIGLAANVVQLLWDLPDPQPVERTDTQGAPSEH